MNRRSPSTDQRASHSPPRPFSATSQSSASHSSPKPAETRPLLTPVVRSKRTPIACTECRRRQVKCTGGTPQCERCEKRGVKCEYIPCSQQKASSTGSPTPPAFPERQLSRPTPYHASHSSQGSATSWHSTGTSYQDYFPDGRTSFEQQNDWRSQSYGPTASEVQLSQPSYFGGVPVQPVASAPFGRDVYDQATYSYHTHGQPGFQAGIPSHQAYADGSFPSGYVTSDAHLGPGDQSLAFGYVRGQGSSSLPVQQPSHRSPYPSLYTRGGNLSYSAPSGTLVSDFTNQDWTADPTYVTHQGARYH